jgi:DNA-binding PadR family transcriptional regulator
MFSKNLVAASLQPVVLTILSRKEAYGYEIMQRALDLSDGRLKWTAGTLYPLMHRLEGRGLIASVWRPSDSGPRRKYYRLTTKGAAVLEADKREWLDFHSILMNLWGSELSVA